MSRNMYGQPKKAFPIPEAYKDVEKDFDFLLFTLSPANKVNMMQTINQLPMIERKQELDIGAYLIGHPEQNAKHIEKLKYSFYRIYKVYEQSEQGVLSEREIAHFFELLRIAIRPYTLFQNRGKRIHVMQQKPAGNYKQQSRKSKSPKVESWGKRLTIRVKKT